MSPALAFALLASALAAAGKAEQSQDCVYDGRRHSAGATVRIHEDCLTCVCVRGALSCWRRPCPPLPEPPSRCHVEHRRGECCPQLRCPDGVKHHEASSNFVETPGDAPPSVGHACVEGGTVFAAGSAMSSSAACEQCFCLGGARRCVRPQCLPPPPGCRARPAPGACCPQRYYCEHMDIEPTEEKTQHDCVTSDGSRVTEGQRVITAEVGSECVQCFCLRGAIRCQHLSCAPSLLGCTPSVRPGQCCPHQYRCGRRDDGTKPLSSYNRVQLTLKDENRSFHISKTSKRETMATELTTATGASTVSVTNQEAIDNVGNEVKQNKDEPNITPVSQTTNKFNDITSNTMTAETVRTEDSTKEFPTEQPEGSIKVIINGTINCTAELSSTSLLLNVTGTNNTMWIDSQARPRIPITNIIDIEAQTSSSNDIITEGFEDNETFTINVTSSLRTNTTQQITTTTKPSSAPPAMVSPALVDNFNVSKTKKEEYDYDYTEPTLPPSLPNLKIIPFVAADAVLEEDIPSKEGVDYGALNDDDKFPVYYSNKETKEASYAPHRDAQDPTQYPIFISKKIESQFPESNRDTNVVHSSITNRGQEPIQEYTVSTSLGNSAKTNSKPAAQSSDSNNKFEIKVPAFNLFSPPLETEGGFIPKGPQIIDDYYSVYTSTPKGIQNIPHLTTSMQLEPKDECIASDGRRVIDGDSISLACSVCTCAWGELHCAPRPCLAPPGCKRRDANISITDFCCGDLICNEADKRNSSLAISDSVEGNKNVSKLINEAQEITTTARSIIENNSNGHGYVNYNNTLENNQTADVILPVKSVQSSATEKRPLYITSTEIPDTELSENFKHSQEYDDEDEEFSFGNVLKLLLSETYETTTFASKKNNTITNINTSFKSTSAAKVKQPPPPENGFVPVTNHFSSQTPTNSYLQHTVDKIDHLVLGELNAIGEADDVAHRPDTFKPIPLSTVKKIMNTVRSTERPAITKSVEIASKDGFGSRGEPRPPPPLMLSSSGSGLPKLAGCNIYGRMYRVERIIAELSSACQECKCTELGVHCRPLSCS